MEAWFRVTESTTSLVTVKFSQWIQFFCSFVSCFTSQGQTLFPPRPFFEPLWRGCNISCHYNLISSQFLSCRQQQGARHGLTPKYSLWLAEGFCIQHWTLCCCYLVWCYCGGIYIALQLLHSQECFFGEKQINVENAYMPHRLCSQAFFMHACDLP